MGTKSTGRLLVADDIGIDEKQTERTLAAKACAAALAKRLGSSVDLVHVDDFSSHVDRWAPEYKPLVNRFLTRQKTRLGKHAQGLKSARTLFLSGEPADQIVSLGSKKGRYELITLSTHGRKGLNRVFLGSVAEEVIRRSMIPVLTIGPKAAGGARRVASEKQPVILLPTGLTPNTDRAEEYAVSLTQRMGGRLVLFHSVHESLHPVLQTAFAGPSAAIRLNGLLLDIRNRAAKLLENKARKLRARGIPVSVVVDDRTLSASQAILVQARKSGAALVVMGTHGRSLLAGAFLGKTAHEVLVSSSVPVITVRSRRG